MDWEATSNPALVEAIVASFSGSSKQSALSLSTFTYKDWKRTELWLDSSGLALYFIDRLSSAGVADAIDNRVRRSLEQKSRDNQERTTDMLKEFVAINRLFEGAGILYANLKGFTVAPDSCPNISLRHQSDYDFLVDPAHLVRARALLVNRGYVLTGATTRTLEFKYGSPQQVSIAGRYKAQETRFVELHTALGPNASSADQGKCDERLNRLARCSCDGGSFPALSSADQLVGQALHLLGHLRGEHTRLAWLLEYRHHVIKRQADDLFWNEVATLAHNHPDVPIALGLCTRLANEFFATVSCPALDSWTADVLPSAISLWAVRYGRRSVLADLPGTKLYLLLDMAIAKTRASYSLSSPKHRLMPLRLPARILRPPAKDSFRLRLNREVVQLRYILYRLRFHAREAWMHAIESRRWRKLLEASSRTVSPAGRPSTWCDESRPTRDSH